MLPQTLTLFLLLLFAIIRSIKRQFSVIVEPAPLLHSLGVWLLRPCLQLIFTKPCCKSGAEVSLPSSSFFYFFFFWFHVNDHFHNRYGRFRSKVGTTVLLPWWNGTQLVHSVGKKIKGKKLVFPQQQLCKANSGKLKQLLFSWYFNFYV